MVDEFSSRKRMFKGMGDFAKEARSEELRAKYGEQEPEVEEVPGTEETADGSPLPEEGGEMPTEGEGEAPQDIEALLQSLSPEELEQLLSMK